MHRYTTPVLDQRPAPPPGRRGAGPSLSQLALTWVLREPNVASAIIGASRPEQVLENAAASGIELDAATLTAIDAALPA